MTSALVVTVSDRVSAGAAIDRSGPALVEGLTPLFDSVETLVVPDGTESVAAALRQGIESGVSLIITTGGTGFGSRDLTPEATKQVIDRDAPGLAEAIRAVTLGVNPHGMLGRGVAGIAGSTLIVNVPGSERGARESLDAIITAIPHAIALLADDGAPHSFGDGV
jgi:molybdenum cofactor biosynthesis protein B